MVSVVVINRGSQDPILVDILADCMCKYKSSSSLSWWWW